MEWKYELISVLCRRRWTRKTIRDKLAGSTLGISFLLSFLLGSWTAFTLCLSVKLFMSKQGGLQVKWAIFRKISGL